MAFNEELADRIREYIFAWPGLSEKKMFGGIAFLVNGNMCCGVINDDLIVRLDPDSYESALSQGGTREFDFSGRPMKGWVFVTSEVVTYGPELERWLESALSFVENMPQKTRKGMK